jgi:hydrogenase maturation protein HypF
VLRDACEGDNSFEDLALFGAVPPGDRKVVGQMLEAGVNVTTAHGMGRYFDAAGALGLARPTSHYEGQIALEWNMRADAADQTRYDTDVASIGPMLMVDSRPLFRGMVADLRAGVAPEVLSARFHNTVAAVTADLVHRLIAEHGDMPVVLTGGCFQNARLAETILRRLGAGVRVYTHESVPPGDGGLSLGQALVAANLIDSSGRTAVEGVCA